MRGGVQMGKLREAGEDKKIGKPQKNSQMENFFRRLPRAPRASSGWQGGWAAVFRGKGGKRREKDIAESYGPGNMRAQTLSDCAGLTGGPGAAGVMEKL